MADEGVTTEARAKARTRRSKTYYAGTLHIRELTAVCRVRDLSQGGALIETNMPLWEGAPCSLDLPKIGSVTGVLVWVDWPRAGMAFATPIEPATLQLLLGQPPSTRVRPVESSAPGWQRPKADTIRVAQERARDAVSWLRTKPRGR